MKKQFPGFDTISITDIPDYESEGIYLRHQKTGLEIFHLFNNDKENLFAFAFRTPAKDSTGAPHILEHSVLCGSEKYPLKEPFVNLLNQSMATFLNAMTYPDKTVYPASSMNKTDYFNLMSVYGDAVFFPLLKKETFMQEAHRIEYDEKGNISLQGVVYNEMKGNYSSFNSIAISKQIKSVLHNTIYDNDSGGDPLAIPSFTYEKFVDFHKNHYNPSNCLLFLYGNIPTEEQIEFLKKDILKRLEKKFPTPQKMDSYPAVPENFLSLETPQSILEPGKEYHSAPITGAHGSTATVNWLCGNTDELDSLMECMFLSVVLSDRDSAPLSKILLDSQLGESIAPASGVIPGRRNFLFSLGLTSVKKENTEKINNLVLTALQNIYEKGIDQKDIDSAVLAMDFWNREIVRSGGPFSLTLMSRALNGWNYGTSPADTLCYRAAFDKIKKTLTEDSHYTEKLIYKYLLNNKNRMFTVVSPEESFLEERSKKEQKIIQQLSKQIDKTEITDAIKKLHDYQQHKETIEEVSCIPSIHPSLLSPHSDPIQTEITSCKGKDNSTICLFLNKEPANGIVYIDVGFPVDGLSAEDYPLLPLFTSFAMNTGWNGKNWSICESEASLCSGGGNVFLSTSSVSKTPDAQKAIAATADKNYTGRDWIFFTLKTPVEKTEKALSMFSEALQYMDFRDTDRMEKLRQEYRTTLHSSIIPSGSQFAVSRSNAAASHAKTVNEIWHGITQLYITDEILKIDIAELGDKFSKLKNQIKKAGAVIHITSDETSINTVLPFISDFSKKAGLTSLLPKTEIEDSLLLKKIQLSQEEKEIYVLSTQTGFAATAMPTGNMTIRKLAVQTVLSHWMNSHPLWDKIRTSGGAYGASSYTDGLDNRFVFTTYRDPKPLKSLTAFQESLSLAAKAHIGKEETDKAITGTYSDIIQPYSPSTRGFVGFKRILYGIPESDTDLKLKEILSITENDIKEEAESLLTYISRQRCTVICDKSIKTAVPTIELPL